MDSNLKQRVSTSIIFVASLLACLIIGEISSIILVAVMVFLCSYEFFGFFNQKEIKPQKILGILLGLGILAVSIFQLSLSYLLPLIVAIFLAELYTKNKKPIENIAITLLSASYIAIPLSLFLQLAYFENSVFNANYLFAFFLVLWLNDTAAYFAGRAFGKRKLFERISPKKTWAGSVGGAIAGLLVGWLNHILFPEIPLDLALIMAAVIVVFGSFGDLVESLFKRSLNLKDSGSILPGHGGVLDRFDGIFISAPMVYFAFYLYFQ